MGLYWNRCKRSVAGRMGRYWPALTITNDTKLRYLFKSKIWKCCYNSDIFFVSERMHYSCMKYVYDTIPKIQHRPLVPNLCNHQNNRDTFPNTFQFKRFKWSEYSDNLDTELEPASRSNTRKLNESSCKSNRQYLSKRHQESHTRPTW